MITLTASSDFNTAGKQYVARITGRNSKFTFEREFIGTRSGKRNDYTRADIDDPGLYEGRDTTRKGNSDWYRLVVRIGEGDELGVWWCNKEEAMKIARLLDERVPASELHTRLVLPEDRKNGEIGFITAAQAERAEAAQTIESAIAACWAAIEALPEKDQKKVLAALRARVSPPKTAEPAPAAPEPETAPETAPEPGEG